MTEHTTHTDDAHPHVHGPDCGHLQVTHDDHTDYLHEGHLHRPHDDHVDEHEVAAEAGNPSDCTPGHDCEAHETGHVHGPDCGHEPVPHADHTDYLADGHLHRPHMTHCDDHGALSAA